MAVGVVTVRDVPISAPRTATRPSGAAQRFTRRSFTTSKTSSNSSTTPIAADTASSGPESSAKTLPTAGEAEANADGAVRSDAAASASGPTREASAKAAATIR